MNEAPALIADIGGTHIRFALVRPGADPADAVTLRCGDYSGPAEAARGYLATVRPDETVTRAAFAVASPILGDEITLTNSAWRFSIAGLRDELGLERLDVVNDFTAVALSVPRLAATDLIKLGGDAPMADRPIGVLGPGTGLGVSALVPVAGGGWQPLTTEGGHVTMAATDDDEAAVLDWLRRRHGHVSAERVVSGQGLVNLYEALNGVSGRKGIYNSPDMITRRAFEDGCPLCRRAVDMFFAMTGAMAGNLALTLGALGGIYVAGGILPRMVDAFVASAFRERFEDKGRFRSYLAPIPTWLVIHPHPAFAGLAGLATGKE